jgi:hypothetical protein
MIYGPKKRVYVHPKGREGNCSTATTDTAPRTEFTFLVTGGIGKSYFACESLHL